MGFVIDFPFGIFSINVVDSSSDVQPEPNAVLKSRILTKPSRNNLITSRPESLKQYNRLLKQELVLYGVSEK